MNCIPCGRCCVTANSDFTMELVLKVLIGSFVINGRFPLAEATVWGFSSVAQETVVEYPGLRVKWMD